MKRFFSRLIRFFRIAPAQLDKPTSDLLAHYADLIRAIEAKKGKLTAAEAAHISHPTDHVTAQLHHADFRRENHG